MKALDVSRVINVSVALSAQAVQTRGFGTLMIMGTSPVISMKERYRSYTSLEQVAIDFGISDPEYLAASLFYSQEPKPLNLMIGRWASAATEALLKGGDLSSAEQLITRWTAITAGYFVIPVNGSDVLVSGLDFSSFTNLNQVAAAITTIITDSIASMSWDGTRFKVLTTATGASATIGYVKEATTPPSGGVYIGNMLKLTSLLAVEAVDGCDAEEPLEAVLVMSNMNTSWYGITFATSTSITDEQYLAVAAGIEGLQVSRVFGITVQDANTKSSVASNTLVQQLEALDYARTICLYSSSNPYAICSMFGRAFSVDFTAQNEVITLKFKQLPGVVYEQLTETEANVLASRNCNVFVYYNNDTAILQEGVMVNGSFFDERHSLDWWQNAVQTAVWNLLYTNKTKIPQTNAGAQLIAAVIARVCEEAINNGMLSDETLIWMGDSVGQLEKGNTIDGYYIYTPPVNVQSQADREARKSPAIKVALKLSGSIHSVDVIANVNR